MITEVDGQRVTDGIALIVAIRTHQPGETVEFTVVRDGTSDGQRTLELRPCGRRETRPASLPESSVST